MPGGGLLLQRRCACGGSAGASGECAACLGQKHLQAKLTIGASNDPLEREADRVADQVLAAPTSAEANVAPPSIQRFTGQPDSAADVATGSVEQTLASPGRPLDAALQQDMGRRFGHDFARVRVHADRQAAASARSVNALAYTVGQNIVFGAGQYAPTSAPGRKLLAHELTHVLQQAGTSGMPIVQKQEAPTATTDPQQEESKSQVKLQLTEPDFLGLRKPFFDRNAYQLWDPDSALDVWKYNVDFFKGFGFTENWARKAANLTAPFAIDAQLKVGNPTWWEITDRELQTTSFVGAVPLFNFDANFRNWKPLPFLQF